MPNRFILGIDGGGTKTVCVVALESGEIIGRGIGGPANRHSVGLETASESLHAAISASLHAAGLTPEQIVIVSAGLAGASRADDHEVMGGVLKAMLPNASTVIEHDAVIALIGATDARPGIIVISGTGSMAFGIDTSERRARTGGWGFMLGDEGSGFDIARRGLIACLRAYDGRGPETAIGPRVLQLLGLANAEDLIPALYTNPLSPGRVAALYPLVLEAADEGDEIAVQLIQDAAFRLAEMASVTASKLHFDGDEMLFTTAGGVFQGRAVRDLFVAQLLAEQPKARLIEAVASPEEGAVKIGIARLQGRSLIRR